MSPNNEFNERLPIKVIFTSEDDLIAPEAGRGSPKIFDEDDFTPEMKQRFVSQVQNIVHTFMPVFKQYPKIPAVARVVLKDKAIAKSHRPTALFSESTCPIIGCENFGTLLIRLSLHGLLNLAKAFTKDTIAVNAAISTLVSIAPYTYELPENFDESKRSFKLRLFNYGENRFNDELETQLLELSQRLDIPLPRKLKYATDLNIFEVMCKNASQIKELSSFVGTQSLTNFTEFDVESQALPVGRVDVENFPKPVDEQYPVVGLIDTGISPDNTFLQPWIIDRDEEDVHPTDQDNAHGTFIAGLIVNGRDFNHGEAIFPKTKAKIVDIVAMPKGGTDEYALLETIRRVVPKYSDVKVWNLSINNKVGTCQDASFSAFAMELDEIQQQYGVTFINSAGNHNTLRTWPPSDATGEMDRITPPADTALGITVGSVAHLAHANSIVRQGEPSPFSRRGPGAAFLPKPEVCHYGGNLDTRGTCSQLGIISADPNGNLVEGVGTSYSAPWVSTIMSQLRGNNVSANLAKALIIHSAVLRGKSIRQQDFIYRGFGIPQDVDDISVCQPWNATMIFEPQLLPLKKQFDRSGFPLPACLKNLNGSYRGELFVTLVYDPPLLPRAGAEYCQVNVDVSIGRRSGTTASGRPSHHGAIKLQPEDVKDLFEENQIAHGFKWSPVKVYKKSFKRLEGDEWGLRLEVLYRDHAGTDRHPQNVALLVTIADPERKQPVYNEVVQLLNQRGWSSTNLNLSSRIRQQARM
ncbi:MAG: S8 family peptidase [Victivallaceae bacterium]